MATLNALDLSDLDDSLAMTSTQSSEPSSNIQNNKKRPAPGSPDDSDATTKQQERQIRRRNSIGDLRGVLDKKGPTTRKTPTDKIIEALTSATVLDRIVPTLSDKLCETISKTFEAQLKRCVEEHVKPLVQRIDVQEAELKQQGEVIKKQGLILLDRLKDSVKLKERCTEYEQEINSLHNKIEKLETRIEHQEQYSRRTSLRFHNVQVSVDDRGRLIHPVDTDSAIIGICKDHLNINLTKDDISRSHVIGKTINGKTQVIVRFMSYRTRERVYNAKKSLKNHPDKVHISENLTEFRNSIVRQLGKLRYQNLIDSYWTADGKIFAKMTASGHRIRIRDFNDLDVLEDEARTSARSSPRPWENMQNSPDDTSEKQS